MTTTELKQELTKLLKSWQSEKPRAAVSKMTANEAAERILMISGRLHNVPAVYNMTPGRFRMVMNDGLTGVYGKYFEMETATIFEWIQKAEEKEQAENRRPKKVETQEYIESQYNTDNLDKATGTLILFLMQKSILKKRDGLRFELKDEDIQKLKKLPQAVLHRGNFIIKAELDKDQGHRWHHSIIKFFEHA